jgi:ABC-2 type transport system ATP-binding protein
MILDEPTTGLDPNQLVEIRDLIKNIGKDKTVFLSTHIMQEVEAICDRIIIIDKGKIVTDKKLNNLVTEEADQIIEVEFDKKVNESIFTSLPNLKLAKNTHDLVWELTFTSTTDMRPTLFDFAQENQVRTLQIVLKSKNLEQIFREKTAKK